MKYRDIIYVLVIGVLIALLLRSCGEAQENRAAYLAASDSLTYSYDELGRQRAETRALRMTNRRALKQLHTRDTTIQWLKQVVSDYKGRLHTAAVVASKTESKGNTLKPTIVRRDTNITDTAIYIYPQYKIDWENQWEKGSIFASRDSIAHNISILNGLELTIGEHRNKLFQPLSYTVHAKNLNPNTTVSELKSITFKPKIKRFVVSAQLGAGVSIPEGRPTFYVGIGFGIILFQI